MESLFKKKKNGEEEQEVEDATSVTNALEFVVRPAQMACATAFCACLPGGTPVLQKGGTDAPPASRAWLI